MACNGWLSGPLMAVHESDYLQLTPVDPAGNGMPRNIDFHGFHRRADG